MKLSLSFSGVLRKISETRAKWKQIQTVNSFKRDVNCSPYLFRGHHVQASVITWFLVDGRNEWGKKTLACGGSVRG